MAPQASKKCGLLSPDHQQIGCCASNSLNSEQVPGTLSVLTISPLSPQASAQSENRLLTPFSDHKRRYWALSNPLVPGSTRIPVLH
jgi:hypothetical protein